MCVHHFVCVPDLKPWGFGMQPEVAEGHANLASAYKDATRQDVAIASYRNALELRPDFPDAFANLVHSLQVPPPPPPPPPGDGSGSIFLGSRALPSAMMLGTDIDYTNPRYDAVHTCCSI